MFDIVKKKASGTTTVFFCINDKKEKALYTQLEKIINEQGSTDGQKSNHIDAGIDLFFTDIASLINPLLFSETFSFCDFKQNPNQIHFPILGPPPKQV